MADPTDNVPSGMLDVFTDQVVRVIEYIPVVIGAHAVSGMIGTALGVLIGTPIAHAIAMRHIQKGAYAHGEHMDIHKTHFAPTGEMNTDTGEEYRDQVIDVKGELRLAEAFSHADNKPVLRAVKKAIKKAARDPEASRGFFTKLADIFDEVQVGLRSKASRTHMELLRESPAILSSAYKRAMYPEKGNPNVLLNLPEIVGEERWPAMQEFMAGLMVRNVSKRFNHEHDTPATDRHRAICKIGLVLPIVEESYKGNEARWLHLEFSQDGEFLFPDIENVRFEDTTSQTMERVFVADDSLPHADRYQLIQRILTDLEDPENQWLKDFSFEIHTGKYEEIDQPVSQAG